ncbi:MAG: PAS domain-containing sensor histidine kinase, partial [Myxococcaceae bacterium]
MRQLLEGIPDPLVATDTSERIRCFNPAAARVLGWSQEELLGRPFLELVPEPLRTVGDKSFLRHVLDRMPSLHGRPIRTALLRNDGLILELDCTAGRSGQGEDERWVLSMRQLPDAVDLTEDPPERLLPLAPSEESAPPPANIDRFYQLIFATAPLGLLHFNRRGVVTACNDYLLGIAGAGRERLIGLHLRSLKDRKLVACIQAVLRGESAYFDGPYLTVTGNRNIFMRAHFAPCMEGGVVIVEDVTEQRRSDIARAHATALLDLLFKTAPMGIAVFDPSLRCVALNKQLTQILGKPDQVGVGTLARDLLPGPIAKDAERVLRLTAHSSEPPDQGETLQQPGGGSQERTYQYSVHPVDSVEGARLGIGVFLQDVTERKLVEQRTQRLYEEAQEAVRARNDFLSVVSHELKTPLTPLFLRVAALERSMEKSDRGDPALIKPVRGHLLRLTALINDLLDVARIGSGKLSVQLVPTRLDSLVEGVVNTYADRREHPLELSVSKEPVWVQADSNRFEQVLVNLLDN